MSRCALVTFAALAALPILLASPADARELPGPQESYLFTVDGARVTVAPGKGDAAKVVITEPDAIRFSDRPYRHQLGMTITQMLGEFGWDATTHKLARATPNAAVSIGGHSQVVDIRKAVPHPGRLVLSVRGIAGPLTAVSGPGSLFIDNTVTFPVGSKTPVDGMPYTVLNVMMVDEKTAYVDVEYAMGVVASTIVTPDNLEHDTRWYIAGSNGDEWWDVHIAATLTDTALDVVVTFTWGSNDGPADPAHAAPVVATRHYDL